MFLGRSARGKTYRLGPRLLMGSFLDLLEKFFLLLFLKHGIGPFKGPFLDFLEFFEHFLPNVG